MLALRSPIEAALARAQHTLWPHGSRTSTTTSTPSRLSFNSERPELDLIARKVPTGREASRGVLAARAPLAKWLSGTPSSASPITRPRVSISGRRRSKRNSRRMRHERWRGERGEQASGLAASERPSGQPQRAAPQTDLLRRHACLRGRPQNGVSALGQLTLGAVRLLTHMATAARRGGVYLTTVALSSPS